MAVNQPKKYNFGNVPKYESIGIPVDGEPIDYSQPLKTQSTISPEAPKKKDYYASDEYRKLQEGLKKQSSQTANELSKTGVMDQLAGGFLKPFENIYTGKEENSSLNAYQIPFEDLTTPQKIARGVGHAAGTVVEYAPISKAIGAAGIGEAVTSKLLKGQATKFAESAMIQPIKQRLKSAVGKKVIGKMVDEALSFGTVAGIETHGDPTAIAEGAVLGAVTPPAVEYAIKPAAQAVLKTVKPYVEPLINKFKDSIYENVKSVANATEKPSYEMPSTPKIGKIVNKSDLPEVKQPFFTSAINRLSNEAGSIPGKRNNRTSLMNFVLNNGGIKELDKYGREALGNGDLRTYTGKNGVKLFRKDATKTIEDQWISAKEHGWGNWETADEFQDSLRDDIGAFVSKSDKRYWHPEDYNNPKYLAKLEKQQMEKMYSPEEIAAGSKTPKTGKIVDKIEEPDFLSEVDNQVLSPEEQAAYNEKLGQEFTPEEISDLYKSKSQDLNKIISNNPSSPEIAPKMKELKFIKTVRDSPTTAPEVAAAVKGDHQPIVNKETYAAAKDLVNRSESDALDLVRSDKESTANTTATAMALMDKYQKEKNFENTVDVAQVIAEKLKTAGQTIQIASHWNKLSPENVTVIATKVINDAQEADKEGFKLLVTNTKKLKDSLNSINESVVDDIIDDVANVEAHSVSKPVSKPVADGISAADNTIGKGSYETVDPTIPVIKTATIKTNTTKPASTHVQGEMNFADKDIANSGYEAVSPSNPVSRPSNTKTKAAGVPKTNNKLAERIINILKIKKAKEFDPLKETLDTLYQVAKQQIPKTINKSENDVFGIVRRALKDKTSQEFLWNDARKIIEQKFINEPEKVMMVNQYFNHLLERNYTDQQLNMLYKTGAKGLKLSEIVKQHYTKQEKIGTSLVDKIIEKLGVTKEEAKILSDDIAQMFKEKSEAAKISVLKTMFRPSLGKTQKGIDQKIFEMSNLGAFSDDKYINLVAKKLGMPSMDAEFAEQIHKMAQDIQIMPEGMNKIRATEKLKQTIANKIPVGFWKKVDTAQTIGQLLNPKTITRNIIGNTIFKGAEDVSQTLGSVIDRPISWITGKRSVLAPNLKAQAQGAASGLKEGMTDVLHGVDTSGMSTQFDLPSTAKNGLPQPEVFKSLPGRMINKAMSVALRVPDRMFSEAAKQEYLANARKLAQINGVVFDEAAAIKKADEIAKYRTFQDDNELSEAFQWAKTGLNKLSSYIGFGNKDHGLGSWILKYPKTPANLIDRGVNYSPVSFGKAFWNLGKRATKRGVFDQEKFVRDFSRGTVGTAVIGAGYYLADLGILTAAASKDKKIRTLKQEEGVRGYQLNSTALQRFLKTLDPNDAVIKPGDKLVNYDWAQPVALNLAIGANMAQGVDTGKLEQVSRVVSSLEEGVNSIYQQPLLSGVSRALGGREVGDVIESVTRGAISSYVPTIVSQVNQKIDNKVKDTTDPNPFITPLNLAKAKIPGLSQTLPNKIGLWGEEIERYKGDTNSFFNVFFNPAFVTKFNPSPETKLVFDLINETGESSHIPKEVNKTITHRGFTINPDSVTKNEMQKYQGQMTREMYTKLVNSPEFMAMDDDEKVGKITEDLNRISSDTLLKFYGDKFLAQAKNGKDPKKYIQVLTDLTEYHETQKAKDIYDRMSVMSDKDKAEFFKNLDAINPYLADKLIKVKAEKIYPEVYPYLLGTSDKERQQLLNSLSDTTYNEVKKIRKKELERGNKELSGLNNRAKADYIFGVINKMKTKEEQNKYIKDLDDKGFISDDLWKKIKLRSDISKEKPQPGFEQYQMP